MHVKQFGLESKFEVILAIGKSVEGVHGTLRLQVTDSSSKNFLSVSHTKYRRS